MRILRATGTGSCERGLSAGESKSLRDGRGALVEMDVVGEKRDQVEVMRAQGMAGLKKREANKIIQEQRGYKDRRNGVIIKKIKGVINAMTVFRRAKGRRMDGGRGLWAIEWAE
jgi:hypothetical protein